MKALRLLGALWLLPVAIPVWLLYLLPAWWLRCISLSRRHGLAVEFHVDHCCAPLWWRSLWRGWGGHAMPFAIVLSIPAERIRRHELRHTDQWLLLGPLFPVVYLLLLAVYGYDAHPLERDADRHAEEA